MNTQFSLALGGGAARGLAHKGIIERLEEIGVVPIEISGTSIGAIIGTLYASGYTATEMRAIANDVKILQLVDLDLKNGLLKGNKIMKFLGKYLGDKNFSDLKIPLSIVATNIDTGEKIVFREGRVIDAIRASISIPGIFIPFKYKGMHLVDGGIMENLPIEVLPEKHPVIAVSVQIDTKKRIKTKKSFFFPNGTMISNSYQVIRKMVGIMMYQNELKSIESRDNVVVIRPKKNEIDYYDFKKVNPMIDEGYRSSFPLLDFFNT